MTRYHAKYEQFCLLKRSSGPDKDAMLHECYRAMQVELHKNKNLPPILLQYAEEDLGIKNVS